MSFLSNAVKSISRRKKDPTGETWRGDQAILQDEILEQNFSLRNYVKESFSMLIVKPLSGHVLKIIRSTSLLIIGISTGVAIALLCLGILMQFGSIENTVLSFLIQNKLEKLVPESDLSMKSAMLSWNTDAGAIEIVMSRVRLDDLSIPNVTILPDYKKSLKQQRLIVKSVSFMNPRISLGIENDFKTIYLNPNLEKGGDNKALLEPLSTLNNCRNIFDDGTVVKLVNASLSIAENGVIWKLNNVYCEHKIGENFPKIVDFSTLFPEQGHASNINLVKSEMGDKTTYDVKIESLNPFALSSAFARRNIPIDNRIFMAIDGYNLPVSGKLKLNFEGKRFEGGTFDLIGSTGSIKLPTRSTLSLNLGKRIDNGSISGSFLENKAKIDSISISYGNSGLQLTGIEVPLSEFKCLDVANINGTLSLTNIDVHEMETILPDNISRSAVFIFKNYLEGFKLELFKIDINGTIAFGNRSSGEKLNIGQGIFKIKDAKIPIGEHIVSNVTATGVICDDGFDIKLSNALFRKTKINHGSFFISNKDNSWIGKINADVSISDINACARDVSPKLASMPFEKMHMKGNANIDMKLVRVEGDNLLNKNLPFRIIEGEGVIKSDRNTKELRLSWNNGRLLISGEVNTGKNKISIKMDEDIASNSGNGEFCFVSNSDFLDELIPNASKLCSGDYVLKINSSWKNKFEEYDVELDLKDATMFIPMVGDIKSQNEDGRFVAHVVKNNGNFEFSKMFLDTKNSKIGGKMALDGRGNLLKCSLDEFIINGSSAKINVLREGNNILFSAVGDYLDASRMFSSVFIDNQVDPYTTISAYINLKEANVFNDIKVKNIKGSLDIRSGKVIGGACYAVIGEDTTLALAAKDINGTSDILLSLSASNAGDFLKYLKVTDTVSGGSLNFVIKSSKKGDQSLSGVFEMGDFIVKNNTQLIKLVSLSSTSWLSGADSTTVGFNFLVGNLSITKDTVIIENGKAIGPTICISFNGPYDRINDNFDVSGILVPMSAILGNQNSSGVLTANYQITGSLGMPMISVKPLKIIDNYVVNETFGNMLPIMFSNGGINNSIAPSAENLKDPFSQGAFDRVAKEIKQPPKPTTRRSVNDKFGIKITRGVKSSN
ncbi:MAG: hypothetical protein LBQ08_01730 [Holosporaceae bacterium]|nr:hypothetical protein [Holosporaceae bacterium]